MSSPTSIRLSLAAVLVCIPSLAAAQLAPVPLTSAPSPPPIIREGFTIELDVGVGLTHIAPDGFESDTRGGLSGLNLGLGGWATPQTAVTFRIVTTSFFENETQLIAGMVGVNVKQMVGDAGWLAGGLGIGVLTSDDENSGSERGLGLDLRAGVNFLQSNSGAYYLAVEVQPGFFEDGRVTGIGLQIGWQKH